MNERMNECDPRIKSSSYLQKSNYIRGCAEIHREAILNDAKNQMKDLENSDDQKRFHPRFEFNWYLKLPKSLPGLRFELCWRLQNGFENPQQLISMTWMNILHSEANIHNYVSFSVIFSCLQFVRQEDRSNDKMSALDEKCTFLFKWNSLRNTLRPFNQGRYEKTHFSLLTHRNGRSLNTYLQEEDKQNISENIERIRIKRTLVSLSTSYQEYCSMFKTND